MAQGSYSITKFNKPSFRQLFNHCETLTLRVPEIQSAKERITNDRLVLMSYLWLIIIGILDHYMYNSYIILEYVILLL